MRSTSFITVVSFFVAAQTACTPSPGSDAGPICTMIGCTDGLSIHVTPTSAWPAGAYRWEIEADGVATTCTGSLPLPACGTPAIACEGGEVRIVESGCALPAAEQAFGDLWFASTPAAVSISVAHDGAVVGQQTYAPTYETTQPNGPKCEPTCTQASGTLALTF